MATGESLMVLLLVQLLYLGLYKLLWCALRPQGRLVRQVRQTARIVYLLALGHAVVGFMKIMVDLCNVINDCHKDKLLPRLLKVRIDS